MKLFLASLASETLDLVLPLLPDKPQNLKLAFIPTAADPYPIYNRPWLVADRAKAVSMGFQITDYDIKSKSISELRKDLSKFQIIFVDGGNTFYLLDQIRKTGFDIVIKELLSKGVIYIGSSAGSIIMGPDIEWAKSVEMPTPDLRMFDGLNLIQKLLIPHFGREKYAERHVSLLKKLHLDYSNDKILPLRDDQALVVNGDNIEVITK